MRIERVAAYIDGFNFYHGLMAKGWGRYRWLDYRALMERFLMPGQQLEIAKYFTTRVTHQPESWRRQDVYLKALERRGGLEVVPGTFEMRKVQCRGACGEWYKRPQEKRTDVNLATHLVADSYEDLFDTAFVLCADSDIIGAVEMIQQRHGRRVVLIDPPRRHSDELAALADSHLHITKSRLGQCQLPDPVEYPNRRGKVQRLHCPESWRPGPP